MIKNNALPLFSSLLGILIFSLEDYPEFFGGSPFENSEKDRN